MTETEPDKRLLYGTKAIAEFLGIKNRAALHLVETKRIPTFKVGRNICARPHAVLAALEALEAGEGPAS
jgi:hypothetical protein